MLVIYPVGAKIRLMCQNETWKLEDTKVKQRHQQDIENKMSLTESYTNIDKYWVSIKDAITESTIKIVSEAKKRKSEDWYFHECREEVKKNSEVHTRANKDNYIKVNQESAKEKW